MDFSVKLLIKPLHWESNRFETLLTWNGIANLPLSIQHSIFIFKVAIAALQIVWILLVAFQNKILLAKQIPWLYVSFA